MFLSAFPANYFKYSLSLQIETSNFRGGGEEPKPLQVMCEYPNPIEKYAKRFCTNTVIKDEMRNFYPVTSIRDFETPNRKANVKYVERQTPLSKKHKKSVYTFYTNCNLYQLLIYTILQGDAYEV